MTGADVAGWVVRLAPPIGQALLQWLKWTTLTVSFDPRQTHDRLPVGNRPRTSLGDLPMGFFTHVVVKNTGRVRAEQCWAQVLSVSEIVGEGEHTLPSFRVPRRTKWANEGAFDPIDIDTDFRGRRLDLCHAVQGDLYMSLFVPPEEAATSVQVQFPKGFYRLRVRVRAKNAPDTMGTFDVKFTGTWDGISVTAAPA